MVGTGFSRDALRFDVSRSIAPEGGSYIGSADFAGNRKWVGTGFSRDDLRLDVSRSIAPERGTCAASVVAGTVQAWSGATYPGGFSEPPAKKYFSISVARNARVLGSSGFRRFSLINMVWCASHSLQACFDTFS